MGRLFQREMKGIAPAQAGESGEVVVRGTQLGIVFNRQGGKVSICCEVSAPSGLGQESTQDPGVFRTGLGDRNRRMVKPTLHDRESSIDRHGLGGSSAQG